MRDRAPMNAAIGRDGGRLSTRTTWSRRWGRAYPAVVLVLAVIALMPRSLAGQATYVAVDMGEPQSPYRDDLDREPQVVSPIQTDQIEHLPLTLKFADELRDGNWQLWDPAVGVGSPTATTFPWLVSPFNLVYVALPGWYATTLDAALTLLVGQVLMFALLRRLGTGRAAATVGAVAYAFTGTNLVFIQRPFGAVWVLPGLLWAVHRAMERTSASRVLSVGAFVAWCWFEGFPSAFFYAVYTGVAFALWLGYRSVARAVADGQLLRTALGATVRRLAWTGAGFGWGLLVSAITLLPFVSEIQQRDLLDLRHTDLHSHLPAFYLWGILDLSVNGDPLDPGTVWGGVNPFESVTMIGSVVLLAAFAFLLPPLSRRLRLTSSGRDAWPFFALLPAVVAFLVFVGTRVLGLVYLVPGIASNPLSRSRFLIALGMTVVGALHLDRVLEPREDGERLPRWVPLVPLAAWIGLAVVTLDDVERAFRAAGQGDALKKGLVIALAFAACACAAVVIVRRLRLAAWVGAVGLSALVFVQVAHPLRDFTPEAPVEDFYPETSGHELLQELGGGEHRFAASAWAYYPNSAQLLGLYDLRGITLYDTELRRLLEAATPSTFARDPLKQVLVREEWNLASPVYDDLALKHFVLSTGEVPFGEVVDAPGTSGSWVPGPVEVPVQVPPGRELAGVGVPLRVSGCAGERVLVELVQGGAVLDAAAKPSYDANGDWFHVALTGAELQVGPASVRIAAEAPCRIETSTLRSDQGVEQTALRLILDDPDDGVRLVATDDGWFYERPNARPLISVHTTWRWFDDQAALLAALRERPQAEADRAFLVGSGPAPPAGDPSGAKVLESSIEDDSTTVVVDTDAPAVVVVAQDHSVGWEARVDGEPTPLESVDGALMGVFVDAGVHEVTLDYRPGSFHLGTTVTIGAVLVGVGALAVAPLKRRRPLSR